MKPNHVSVFENDRSLPPVEEIRKHEKILPSLLDKGAFELRPTFRMIGVPPAVIRYANSEFVTRVRQVAAERYEKLQDEGRDVEWFSSLIEKSPSLMKQICLIMAFAAGRTKEDLENLFLKAQALTDGEVLDKLTLEDVDEDGQEEAAAQLYSHACGPAVSQALRSRVDAGYALNIRENGDAHAFDAYEPAKFNAVHAGHQKALLESPNWEGQRGVAKPRASFGVGRWCRDLFTQAVGHLGIKYDQRIYIKNIAEAKAVVEEIYDLADRGYPVPIVVGGWFGEYAHYVLVTNTKMENGQKLLQIYNPWEAKTEYYPKDALWNEDLFCGTFRCITAYHPPEDIPNEHRWPFMK